MIAGPVPGDFDLVGMTDTAALHELYNCGFLEFRSMDAGTEDKGHDGDTNCALARLRAALDEQRSYLISYEKATEATTLETLRTLDDLFCKELMEPDRPISKNNRLFRSISTWGVNHALQRVIPRNLTTQPLKIFPSSDGIQGQADDFVFNCGALCLAERYEGWIRDGILKGEVREHPNPHRPGMTNVVVLRTADPSQLDEEIGRMGLRWGSELIRTENINKEKQLEKRHRKLERELARHVALIGNWLMTYSSTREIDDYFLEWAKLYLKRIFSQDMIGPDDAIGGRPFARYLEVLEALSARSQKHIAFSAIIKSRHPSIHIRNLLTTWSPRELFVNSLADYMDADRLEIEQILASFILGGKNLDVHTRHGETAWAPIVQASTETLLLPTYGIDINPFLFLLADLRSRYERDWFKIANAREGRWIVEIEKLFQDSRWRTHGKNLRLRKNGMDLTDIDFAIHDLKTDEIALLQLKWQHPIGMDNRTRRSAGKNLLSEGNRWIRSVSSWIEDHGAEELTRRLGFTCKTSPKISLFVLGRYHAHLTGFDQRNDQAVWSDWAHFRRVRMEGGQRSISEIASTLRSALTAARGRKELEAVMVPVGGTAIVLNPKSTPNG